MNIFSHSLAACWIVVFTGTFLGSPLFGQNQIENIEEKTESKEDKEEKPGETITVTGSRIKGVDAEGLAPVIVISEDDIKESTATSISELLNEIGRTRGGEGSFTTASSGALQADSPAGSAAVSLRGLGTGATLVLINGRRVSSSSFSFQSQNFVDTNAIPLRAVKRVEILSGGASAIYGADAIAGVVNIILDNDFEGSEVYMSYGNSEADSDESEVAINAAWGGNLGATHINLFVDYFERQPLYDRDRRATANSRIPSRQGIWPGYSFFEDGDTRPLNDNDFVEESCPRGLRFDGGDDSHSYCAYNQNQFLQTYPERKSWSAGLFSESSFGAVDWFNELTYNRNQAGAISTGAPFNGFEVPLTHPDIPASVLANLPRDVVFGDPDDLDRLYLRMWGRFPEAREIQNTTDSVRAVTGFRGLIGSWDWESAVQYSTSKSAQKARNGIFNGPKFQAALYGELCPDGSIGCDPESGGLFYNPFNGQSSSDEIRDLIKEEAIREGFSTTTSFDFRSSGPLASIGSVNISAAFGLEVRRESIQDRPSDVAKPDPDNDFQIATIAFGSTGAEADRESIAAYGELYLPLLESLNAQLALRYDRYSDFGESVNPKAGFAYRPLDSFLMRGSWSRAFKAPSLAQIGADTSYSSGSIDCDAEFIDTICGGESGSDSYLTEVYGNPDLEAETATTYDFGFALSPTKDMTFTLDYWSIEYENLVGIDEKLLFRQAVADNSLIKTIEELRESGDVGIATTTGEIGSGVDEVHLRLENLGRQLTQGLDFGFTQYFGGKEWGRWLFSLDVTHLIALKRQLAKTSPEESLAGEFKYPKIYINSGLRWTLNDVTNRLTVLYTGSYRDDLDSFSDEEIETLRVERNRRVPAWTKVNWSLGFDVAKDGYLQLAVENLLDDQPPPVYGTSANVDLNNHDTLGRAYRLGYTYTF
ncbi:MAG: TonB-dependent receptor [Pseudobacteriovorax sp.]|nr:TonB-dependent receptor [Pseudobacteriovorax sp.]